MHSSLGSVLPGAELWVVPPGCWSALLRRKRGLSTCSSTACWLEAQVRGNSVLGADGVKYADKGLAPWAPALIPVETFLLHKRRCVCVCGGGRLDGACESLEQGGDWILKCTPTSPAINGTLFGRMGVAGLEVRFLWLTQVGITVQETLLY